MSDTNPLAAFIQAIDSKQVRFVDLTQTLSPSFPALQLPPNLARLPVSRLSASANTTKTVQAGTGTTSPVANTPVPTLTRLRTGFPARTIQTTRSTLFQSTTSCALPWWLMLPLKWPRTKTSS